MREVHWNVINKILVPVVTVEVSLLEEDEVVLAHDLLAQHHRQELVVRDLLGDGRHDVSRFL